MFWYPGQNLLFGNFCHENSWRVLHGNEYDNVNVFGLGGIDLYAAFAAEQIWNLPHSRHTAVSK